MAHKTAIVCTYPDEINEPTNVPNTDGIFILLSFKSIDIMHIVIENGVNTSNSLAVPNKKPIKYDNIIVDKE